MWIQQDRLQRFDEWDSDIPRCLSARKKLREHQTALGTDSSGERKRPLTASKEDTHRDARHSGISPPALAVMKYTENCTQNFWLSFALFVQLKAN